MKALFLLFIIYNLHNFALSQNESTIIHKTYPKKVHPVQDNVKLINTGAYYKNVRPLHPKKPSVGFEPPAPEWKVNKKVIDTADNYFPVEFYGNLKSRVKKLPYFNEKDLKRGKRAVNYSQAAALAPSRTPTPPKSKANDKPGETNPLSAAIPKDNRRSSGHVKPLAKPNHPAKPQAAGKHVAAAKKTALRSKPGNKHSKAKRSARKGKNKRKGGKGGKGGNGGKGGKGSKGGKGGKGGNGGKGGKGGKGMKGKGKKHAKHKERLVASRRLTSARDASPEDYPYVVSIQRDGRHWCTGAILNPRLIITTANCFWKSKAISHMKVRAGAKSVDSGGQIAYIAEVRKHPNWDVRKDPDNDIALALLDRPLKFSHTMHGVDLPNKIMMPAFEDAWVTSYGSDRRDGLYSRQKLQVIYVRLMTQKTCNNITMRFGVRVTDNFICLEQAGRRAPCTRDTGAPAVSDGILWGLASWGIRKLCGTERYPAVYSYVASKTNMNFIMNATSAMMGEQRLSPMLDRPPMRAQGVSSEVEVVHVQTTVKVNQRMK